MPEDRSRKAPQQEHTSQEYSFDELAVGLASNVIPRRKALKLVGAAFLGAIGLAGLPGVADARRRRHRHRICRSGEGCCNELTSVDAAGIRCRSLKCRCPKGKECQITKLGKSVCVRKGVIVDSSG